MKSRGFTLHLRSCCVVLRSFCAVLRSFCAAFARFCAAFAQLLDQVGGNVRIVQFDRRVVSESIFSTNEGRVCNLGPNLVLKGD